MVIGHSHYGNCHSLSYQDAYGGDHALPHRESRTNVSYRVLPPIELCDTDLRRIPLFCSHTRSEAQTGTNIKACSDLSKFGKKFAKGIESQLSSLNMESTFPTPRSPTLYGPAKGKIDRFLECTIFLLLLDQGSFL